LTEIYLCHACSWQDILRTETAGQAAGALEQLPHAARQPPPSAAGASSSLLVCVRKRPLLGRELAEAAAG
jgi:hypothetical protein